MRLLPRVCFVLATASFLPAIAVAQPANGNVVGVVRDAQGGVIAGADIEITCGSQRQVTQTNANGEFNAAALPSTRCAITARSTAFEPQTVLVGAERPGRI